MGVSVWKAVVWFSTLCLTLSSLLPSAQSSRLYGGSMVVVVAAQESESESAVKGFENGGAASSSTTQESARLVPTGPNPIHHNNIPSTDQRP